MVKQKITDKLYEFSQDGNSCTILEPRPPRYWYNYLWNENRYCAQISQIGHGRSYYLSEKADMCMINQNDARYVYLRDEEDHSCWNIGEGPLNTKVEDYQCIHSIGCSLLESKYREIKSSWRIFVPCEGFHEVWSLKIKNTGKTKRILSVFSAVSFYLEGFQYPRYYEMYRCMKTGFDQELNGIYCDSSHPFAPHGKYHGFLASSEPVFAYDGDLARFCGSINTLTQPDASACALFQRPDVLMKGLDCTNSEAALFILGGVLQHKFTLEPGEEKEIHLIFGISESLAESRKASAGIQDFQAVEQSFEEAQEYNYRKIQSLSVHTPDEKINHRMNNWVKKQVDFCIVGKKGVRDNLQIAAALLDYRQEKAKDEIMECLSHQFRDGHAVLTWYPYDDTRYSDQPFWIIWAVCRLIKETGDISLLNEKVFWQDGGQATVLEHVRAAVDRLIADKGKNGLVRIYFADWNDALNITTDPEAESVMLSHQFCLALKELRILMEKTGRTDYAGFLEKEYGILKDSINEHAWDGKWYMRALSTVENIGSKNSQGSKIYLNAQTWAILADVADGERLSLTLEAVDGMEHDFGFPLNMPPYPEYSPNVGRMSGMLPGLFENGGIYCHATGFKILMDCKAGRGNKALETLKKIMPDSEKNPSVQSGAEPYVFTNCYSANPGYYGKSYQSWTTGTSAWCLMGLYEGILGVKADYDGLRVEPCFPAAWESAEMTRIFRGARYHMMFKNPKQLEGGAATITVDGERLLSQVLPDFRDGRQHEVQVEIG
ncbi:MAG: cellobiose phosphorylase [Ruminococcus sp.]|uniref:Cellobiose phosphorylase n=1 Tax=Schaedlerella arabinosiphila TaxID=2044587 RepID=A0A3R8L206_9FIRM|nr:cellobiose phosphorylase [Schaedlerella arabinosiphila]MCI8722371.1 cellobiose phosphorylase [Ruminococcus sp.]RRK34784.1 cellobiose phosphorylase [Schaedlerella arabinosiphila]